METCPQHLLGSEKQKKQVANEIQGSGLGLSPGQGIKWFNQLLSRFHPPLLPKTLGDSNDSGAIFQTYSEGLGWNPPRPSTPTLHAAVDVRTLGPTSRAKQVLDLVRSANLVFKKMTKCMMQTLWFLGLAWFHKPPCTEDLFANLTSLHYPNKGLLFCAR